MKRFISYEGLPINSGGAHRLNRKTAFENYQQTLRFLNKFSDRAEPENIELTFRQSENSLYSTLKLLTRLTWKLGFPKFMNNGLSNIWSWKLSKVEIEKGFETLKSHHELQRNAEESLVLSFLWHFSFKDPDSNQILPHQEKIPQFDSRINNSRIFLRTSNRSTISVWFALPFEQMGEYENNYINKLKSFLPFKTSDKHWRFWSKSVKGNWTPRVLKI